jgi:flagellar FliJ protein
MKGLAALIRLNKWTLEEKRRALASLQGLRADLLRQGKELEAEVVREQQQARSDVHGAWAYSEYARQVIVRRQKLTRSVAECDKRIDAARDDVNAAWRELRKYEMAAEREQARLALEAAKIERQELDEIALTQNRIKQAQRQEP